MTHRHGTGNHPQHGGDHGHQQRHSGLKHMLMMLVCCLVPVGLALGLRQLGYTGVASFLLFLLCPLMHIFMMRGMIRQPAPEAGEKRDNM